MTRRVTSIVFFLFFPWIASYSQADKNSPTTFDSVPRVVFLTKDNLQDKMGMYKLGENLYGTSLNLDSTMHFQKKSYSCVGGPRVFDSGIWFVYKTGRIGLKSKSGLQTFYLMKYRHFYFCIPPNKRLKFVDDFLKSQTQFKKFKTIHIDDVVYTGNDLATYSLMKKYYLRDLNDW